MTAAKRIKRQMVREVVEENLEVLAGRPRGTYRRRRRRAWSNIRGLMLFVLIGALATLAFTGRWNGNAGAAADNALGRQFQAEPRIPRTEPVSLASLEASLPPEPSDSFIPYGDPQPLEPEVIPLNVRRVVLDPGHGGKDKGTMTHFGLLEKELTLDIAMRVKSLLEKASYEVVMTRSRDVEISLRERASLAHAGRGDIFISIHVNWIPDRTRTRGVETYYLGTTEDPYLKELAAAENRDSGFSLADYKQLLDGIYADIRRGESQKLAESVQRSLFKTLSEKNPDLIDRGVKTAPFVVLVATDIPAILAEVSCLSNDKEARQLADLEYRQKIARALFTGIHAYAEALTPSSLNAKKG